MAWNLKPEVAAARDFGNKFGADRVIILYTTGEKLCGASYGKTMALCKKTGELMDAAYKAVEGALIMEEYEQLMVKRNGNGT